MRIYEFANLRIIFIRISIRIIRIHSYISIDTLHHDAFFTPGISPWLANSLKQIRQTPNFLIKPAFRPQRKHRRTSRVLNFGFFLALAMTDVLAMFSFSLMALLDPDTIQLLFPDSWILVPRSLPNQNHILRSPD